VGQSQDWPQRVAGTGGHPAGARLSGCWGPHASPLRAPACRVGLRSGRRANPKGGFRPERVPAATPKGCTPRCCTSLDARRAPLGGPGRGGGLRLNPSGGRGPRQLWLPALAKPPVPAGRQARGSSSLRLRAKAPDLRSPVGTGAGERRGAAEGGVSGVRPSPGQGRYPQLGVQRDPWMEPGPVCCF